MVHFPKVWWMRHILKGRKPNYTHIHVSYNQGSLTAKLSVKSDGIVNAWLGWHAMQAAVERVPQPDKVFAAVYNHFLQLADSVAWPQGSVAFSNGPEMTESSSLAAFMGKDPQADRLLCLRAMAQLYQHHAAEIGETDDHYLYHRQGLSDACSAQSSWMGRHIRHSCVNEMVLMASDATIT